MFKQKTSQWKALSSPAVSIIRNKAVLYIELQLSTRMKIPKIAFEKNQQRLEHKYI